MKPAPRNIGPAVKELYAARNKLRQAFPELPFTLDGKLIGDIGEAIAIADFGLTMLPGNSKDHDFRAPDGRLVQVKTTQKTTSNKSVGLGLEKQTFEHLIVLEVAEDGSYRILYDGPGTYIDEGRTHKSSASLSIKQLTETQQKVPGHQRLLT
jgi:hypothetical protein